jgi:hypothetical protein
MAGLQSCSVEAPPDLIRTGAAISDAVSQQDSHIVASS